MIDENDKKIINKRRGVTAKDIKKTNIESNNIVLSKKKCW